MSLPALRVSPSMQQFWRLVQPPIILIKSGKFGPVHTWEAGSRVTHPDRAHTDTHLRLAPQPNQILPAVQEEELFPPPLAFIDFGWRMCF